MTPGYRVLSLFDEEPVLIEDDRVQWVPVRRRLGIGAFGTNAYRASRAGDAVVLAVGGWRERPYHSLPWEPIYMAQEQMRRGDWAAAAATLEREAGEHIDTAIVQFRLACCHARLGEHDQAIAELQRAIELNPDMRRRAQDEPDLASLRGLPAWPAVLE